MIRTVVFDIDGTMYDYNQENAFALKVLESYCQIHFGLDHILFKKTLQAANQLMMKRIGYPCAAVHNRLIRFQCMLEFLDKPLFPHAMEMYHAYWDTLLDHMRPFPGLTKWMEQLKQQGIKIGIGTNMTAYIQYEKLKRLGVSSLVDWIVTSEEAGAEKPDPRFFKCCILKCGYRADEMLFVGDSLEGDVLAAQKHGMKAAFVCQNSESDAEEERKHGITVISSFLDCLNPEYLEHR